jgi:hypothetical protein
MLESSQKVMFSVKMGVKEWCLPGLSSTQYHHHEHLLPCTAGESRQNIGLNMTESVFPMTMHGHTMDY